MKLIVMLNISSMAFQMDALALIFFTIFLGEFAVAFIKIMKAELSGGLFAKLLGFLIFCLILLASWMILLSQVDGMEKKIADEWAIYFLIAYLINTFCIDPLIVIWYILFIMPSKLISYPWATK
jgi:hypothetical protein